VGGWAPPLQKMQKVIENIQEAQKTVQTIDHLIYVTFPLIQDKKILIKILTETKNSITNCINAILQYEYLHHRIRLCKDAKTNFQIFIKKCAQKYEITANEIDSILKLFELSKKQEQSTAEFVRQEKVVLLSKNLQTEIITIEKTKEFLQLSKNILKKTTKTISLQRR
jgi:hypothetical protein